VAKRRYVSHTLRIKVRPGSFNATLAQGDVVRVLLQRVASSAPAGTHDYLYEVDRIGKSRTGEVSLDLIHFPVDSLNRSLVALDVAAATGGGILFSTTKSGISCDVNSSGDTTPATDDGSSPTLPGDDAFDAGGLPDTDFGTGGGLDGGFGDEGGSAGDGNGGETLDDQGRPALGVPPEGPYIGGTLTSPEVCERVSTQWLRIPPGEDSWQEDPTAYVIAGETGTGYTMGVIDIGSGIVARIFCLDGNEFFSDMVEPGTLNSPLASFQMYFVSSVFGCASGECTVTTTASPTGVFGTSSDTFAASVTSTNESTFISGSCSCEGTRTFHRLSKNGSTVRDGDFSTGPGGASGSYVSVP
jgi:hypothetical protein